VRSASSRLGADLSLNSARCLASMSLGEHPEREREPWREI
jgi:hypothetical protein